MNIIQIISQINIEFIGFLETHHEIEKILPEVNGLVFRYPREPVFFKMSEKVRKCIQDNTKREKMLRTFTHKLNTLNNFLQFTKIVDSILLNFAFLERYIDRMKRDYKKIKGRLKGSSSLAMADFALLEIDKFLNYVPNIQKLYDAYEAFLHQENQKRIDNNTQMDFLKLVEKEESRSYNNITFEYIDLRKQTSPSNDVIPTIMDYIKLDAYQEIAIFQQNKMVKDMYCALVKIDNSGLRKKFEKFLEDYSILNPKEDSKYQNYPQYLFQFPFNTTETKTYSLKEILELLQIDFDFNDDDIGLAIRRIENNTNVKFIVINSQPTARYVDIQDQEVKTLFEKREEIRKKINDIKKQKPLTTIKTSIYNLQDERASLEKRLSDLTKKLRTISEDAIKTIISSPSPDKIKRPLILELQQESTLFETDPLLFRNLDSISKDPDYYIVLFSVAENQFQYIGKYQTFADIPFSTGLFRLVSDGRYKILELGFTIPSEKYAESVQRRQKIIDKLNAMQRGMKGLLSLFHRNFWIINLPFPTELNLKSSYTMKERVLSAKEAVKTYLTKHQTQLKAIEQEYKNLTAVEVFPWIIEDQFKKIEQIFLLNLALAKSDPKNKFLIELEKMNLKIQVFLQEIQDFLILQQYNLTLQGRSTDKIDKLITRFKENYGL